MVRIKDIVQPIGELEVAGKVHKKLDVRKFVRDGKETEFVSLEINDGDAIKLTVFGDVSKILPIEVCLILF